MASGEPDLLDRYPWVTRGPITVAEYHRMGEAGILTEDDRVELENGEYTAVSQIGREGTAELDVLPGVRIPVALLMR